MPRIDPHIIFHHLTVNSKFRPIKQKRRTFNQERREAIEEKVDKLIKAGLIREVFYQDLVANVVMVKKANKKWRMCVDFTNRNKACLKDSFLLPRID